ncbi:four helix bundle protein [Chitinophaga costaii]|uniref:Four helix bundle protein n=1 Tax=Chitinophaga costaii TaxID=1335309 RepID=A0A1C4FKQ7_9BACT|nr:four helix bundle protein [Chitinophaga costaii]PUZ30010.1 four helix bundle protein [Chitinophaga costaii]SCC56205.1 four helix bundle protein [Chitinophaga costaii]
MEERKDNIILEKTFSFAVRVVKLYQFLGTEKKEFVLSKQLLRCGTSVGANVREAIHAESKMDFIHKLGVAQKEISETIYWLDLLHATKYLKKNEHTSIKNDAEEIIKIIKSIILTTKKNIKKPS